MEPIFALQDAAYKMSGGRAIVHLFGRNASDRTVNETIIEHHEPYFYIPSDETDKVKQLAGCRLGEPCTDAFGRPVHKVFTDYPGRVRDVRDIFSFTDESDILYERRAIVDLKIRSGYKRKDSGIIVPQTIDYVPPRILYFDIEVRAPRGIMPSAQKVEHPVASIQIKDSYTGRKFVITYGIPNKIRDTHIPATSEKELFLIFYQLLKKIDPDILTGWYTNQFDIPYLVRRAIVLGVSTKGFCRINDARAELMPNSKYVVRIPGRQCFDMLDGFKKLKGSESQREDYRLKSISADYNFPYKDYGAFIDELLNNEDYDTFLDYCENDVDSLSNIDEKTSMFGFFESIRYFAGCKLEDTIHNSRIIETYLMHEGIKPMPRKQHIEGDPFEGAFVMNPPIGIQHDVGWVDLKSLYPMIMMARDLSPDVDKIVPRLIKHIVDERDKLRELNKSGRGTPISKNQENVFKYLANSFYGVLGSKEFRLFNLEIASAVTRYGREISELVRNECTRLGYTPIYGDTDSVAIKSILSPNEGLILEHKLNSMLKDYSIKTNAKVIFTLKLEKLHSSLMFKLDKKGKKAVKKRYAGLLTWKDGDDCHELQYCGIEPKRSDQSTITKRTILEFLHIAFVDGEPDKAVDHVRAVYQSVLKGNIDIYLVSIPRGIYAENDSPWLRGREVARTQYNYTFDPSTKVRVVYLKVKDRRHEGEPREICIDDTFDISLITDKIDWKIHADKTIKDKLSSYMESIGYTWDQVVNGQQRLLT